MTSALPVLDDAQLASADRAARAWHGPSGVRFRSAATRTRSSSAACCSTPSIPTSPPIIDWPTLDARRERRRLVSLPIWDIAVQTEGKAQLRVLAMPQMSPTRCCGEAIELNGFEEARHKEVLSNLVAAYGIALGARARLCRAARRRMGVHGHRLQRMHRQLLCLRPLRSWRGARATSRRSSSTTFEPVMQEEGRHILFFVNWAAWHRRNLPWWRKPSFAARVRRGLGVPDLGAGADSARRRRRQDNFTMTGA